MGIFFRFYGLDRSIFWVDEVSTAIRVSGFTKETVIREIYKDKTSNLEELQFYQISPQNANFREVFSALSQSPEHAPLYFILTRFWVDRVGGTPGAMRSLSVLFGILAIPCAYALAWELFQTRLAASFAAVLMAISPFQIGYSQEARPYSLWTVAVLLSGLFLLRSLKSNSGKDWIGYGLSLTLAWYTSLLSGLMAIAHGLFVEIFSEEKSPQKHRRHRKFWVAVGASLVLFSPWLLVFLRGWGRFQENTTWTGDGESWGAIVGIWIYSFIAQFVDLPFPKTPYILVLGSLVALWVLALIGVSLVWVVRRTSANTRSFILISMVTPLLILGAIDLLRGGRVSATPRYLVPSLVMVQMAVAGFLGSGRLDNWKKSVAVMVLVLGIASGIHNLDAVPMYLKGRNQHNPPIAEILNDAIDPVLYAEPSQIPDLMSLSHHLDNSVRIDFLTPEAIDSDIEGFLFNPSPELLEVLQQESSRSMAEIYQPQLLTPNDTYLSLWTVVSGEPYPQN
ncbi:glycosyltransferase family 39 protein [Baaleninema sp.]|uniref:glycosyltransferase family 39 protein n=1 Tax=Baaleninema sp. TaxID=3101197 RepID=UPI003D05D468